MNRAESSLRHLHGGVPTIVSDQGALSELPDDVVVKVPVDISGPQLSEVIAELLDNVGRRQALRTAALGFAQRETYAAGARRLIEAVVQSAG